ncbi:MAG: hypothetical protein Q9173_002821 [Seirophora scorigena]
MLAFLTHGLTLSLLVPALIAVRCYHPDGALITDPDYIPCKPENAAIGSSCCALKRIPYPDRCLPNGLCGNGDDLYRDSCTDPTWGNPLCPQLLLSALGEEAQIGGQGERIRTGTSSSSTSTSTNPGTTTLSLANPSVPPTSNNKQSPSLDQKAIIGIAVGCVIVASIIAASAVWFSFRRKRPKRPTAAFKCTEPAEERNLPHEVIPHDPRSRR